MSSDGHSDAPDGAVTPVPPGTPFVELDDEAARRLSVLIGMSQDLDFTAHLLERLQDLLARADPDTVTIKCLWSTALVHYARAFDTGGRGGVRAGDVYTGLKGDPLGAHSDLLRQADAQRQADDNPLDRVRVGVLLEGDDAAQAVTGTAVIAVPRGLTNAEAVHQFAALVDAARRGVAAIGIDAQQRVLESARAEALESLYARARRVSDDGMPAP